MSQNKIKTSIFSFMSAKKQTNATTAYFHETLKSIGVLDLHIVRAFCKHYAGPDGLLAAQRLILGLSHRHHYFPHIEEMIAAAAAGVVHLPSGCVDEGTLVSYLIEKRKSVQVVDLVADELNVIITIPVDLLPNTLSGVLSPDQLPASAVPQAVKFSEATKFRVTNHRELASFTRSKFFKDWVALIRLLEGDPIVGLEVALKEERHRLKFKRHEKFVPAKPELFELPPTHKAPVHVPSRETQLLDQSLVKKGEIQEEGMHLLQRFKGRIARDDAAARASKRTPELKMEKSETRAQPDYPALSDLPYDEGAQIDQTKLFEKEDRKKPTVYRRDVLRCNAANVESAAEYEDPRPFDFRPDIPLRDRKHGRRVYDTQVKSSRDSKEKISGFAYTPLEELHRAQFLQERDHERKFGNFKQNLPKSDMYKGYVVSQNLHESSRPVLLVMHRNSVGLNLYTRGLTAQQLEKRIPLA